MRRPDRLKAAVSIEQALSRSRNPVLGEAMERYRALTPLSTAWKKSVPQPLCRHAQPVALRDGVLTVHVESSVWASLLRNTEQTTLAALQEAGLADLQQLRIRIAPPEPDKSPPEAQRHDDDPELRRRFAQLRRALG